MPSAPSRASAEELALHERLLAGDHTATAQVFERFLEPVTRALLGWRSRGPDTHLIEDAACDAIDSYVQRPAQYDPLRRGLQAYLLMSARGDLKNTQAMEGRLARQSAKLDDFVNTVEVPLTAGNSPVEDEVLERLPIELPPGLSRAEVLRLFVAEFADPVDRRLLALKLDRVRQTAAFVPLLGIQSLSAVEQRRAVKRNKDRIEKRWERFRARVLASSVKGGQTQRPRSRSRSAQAIGAAQGGQA